MNFRMTATLSIWLIVLGVLLFLLPIFLFSIILVHPRYEKKAPSFLLDKTLEDPTPYIKSVESNGSYLRLEVKEATSFKVILFNKKANPYKLYRVKCIDPSKPCWIRLQKGTKGIAFVEINRAKKANFDMEPWKIFIIPLVFAGCAAGGLALAGYGYAWFFYNILKKQYYIGFAYPNRLSILLIVLAGAIAYLIVLLAFLLNYVRFNKKEGK